MSRGMSSRAPLLYVLLATAALAASPARSEPHAFKEGEVLIKFKPDASQGDINSVLGALRASRIKHFGRIKADHERISGISVEEAVRRFRGHRAVAYIEPNYLVHTQAVPNDPSFGDLWGLRNTGQIGGIPGADIHAVDAWDTTTGSDILVAMIDTGVDYTHPDLAPNIYVNPGEIPGNGVDDDHNGFVDDVHGWDFVNHDNEPLDDLGHGTHTAGTVGAVGDNGLGVVGVCWHVKLMPLKFIGGLFGETADAISCIEYATMMHARIMSNSWAGGGFSQALFDAIKDASDTGILFVAAAGNSGVDTDIDPLYPADYDIPNVISVAATTASDDKASFSNYGLRSVDLGAPGVQILSTAPNNSYRYMSGTSMATPHVAGALALILSHFPTLSAGDAKRFLLRSTDPIPLLRGVVATGGRLNVARALQGPDTIPPAPIADLRALAIASNRIKLDWTATGDDGTIGAASSYDLRYATFLIDGSNFDTASQFAAVLPPLPYGFPQEATVEGLLPSTTYYLAIRAEDRFGNTSSVSNVASATTLIPPKIDVTPTAVAASLSSGGFEARTITVRNLTQGTLDFEIEAVAAPSTGAAGLGAAAKSAQTASASLPALTWGEHVRAVSAAHATASAVPAVSSVAASANVASPPVIITDPVQDSALVDLTQVRASSDDTNLNVEMEFNSAIDRQSFGGFLSLDTDQNRATGAPVPFGNGLQDIGADFEIQFFTLSSGVVSVYHTPTRTLIGTFPVTIGSNSLTFRVPLAALGDDEGSMDVAGVVGDITGPTDWFPDSGHGSIAGVRWITVTPSSGTVPPDGSVDLVATLASRGLKEGAYDASIRISSNDPDKPVVPVSAHIDVSGVPSIGLSVTELAFGSVPLGASRSDSIVVSNVGTSRLDVGVSSDTPSFVTDTGSFSLVSGASRSVVVTFTPAGVGSVSGILLIDNNDPETGSLVAFLSGSGVVPPSISVSPTSLRAALISGQTSSQTLSIANTGGSDLAISLSIQNPAPSVSLLSPSAPNPAPVPLVRDVTSLEFSDSSAVPDSVAPSGPIPILVIQDTNAWEVYLGPLLRARFGINPTVIRSDQIAATDFSHYDLIITAGGQFFGYYTALSLYRSKFEDYLNHGGVVQFDLANNGRDVFLPRGARYVSANPEFQNRVLVPAHPLVAGLPWVLEGNYANNGYLTSLPAGAQALTETSISRVPTTVEYSVGLGTVVATGMPWEFLYNFGYSAGPILTQAIAYSISRIHPRWMRTDPTSATVPAGGTLIAEVTFDATWIRGGPHDAVIRIGSNDPDQPEALVPAHLDVTPRPEIDLSRSTLSFGFQVIGGSSLDTIVVSNLGTDVLLVTGVLSSVADFTADVDSFRVAPGADRIVHVAFRPIREGSIAGTLLIRSNDEDEGELRVGLSGTGIPAPVASVAPSALHFQLPADGQGEQSLLLRNTGGSPLTYTVEARGATAAAPLRQASFLPKGAPDPRVGDPVTLGIGGPDQFGYTWLDSDQPGGPAFQWIEISCTGTRVPILGDDQTSQAIPIGFPFSFYGNTFTSFHACSNGFLSFTSDADDFINQPLPSLGAPENLVAAFWDDLFIPSGGGVFMQADSARAVIEFQNVFSFTGSPDFPFTFEVILERGGAIVLQYLSMAGVTSSATIGFQNQTRSDGLAIAFNTPYAHDSLAVRGAAGLPWVRLAPGSGTIAPGGEQSLAATVDARGLAVGAYFSTFRIHTNDPVSPILSVPVTLRVLGQIEAAATRIDPRTLNGAGNGGQVQAHVELPLGTDPNKVLLSTVRFQDSVPCNQKSLKIGDFNSNGIPDLLFQFDRSAVAAILPAGSRVPATVTGEVEDVGLFTGRDTIRVIQPHLNTPNGGESLVSGSRVPITWESPAGWNVDHADLSLSADDGVTWVPVARGVAGQGFGWTVAHVTSTSARVRVDLYGREGLIGTDSSDHAFGIGEGSTAGQGTLAPSVHALYQNSPNPFNPRTEIRFDLPIASAVRLSVYDVDGRLVRTLIHHPIPAGRHRVVWDGTDERGRMVATGVYYYRIAAGAFRASRRLVMVR